MSLDKRLLEILVCPVTKVPVHPLSGDRLATLNREIEAGRISYRDGTVVESGFDEALMTADGRTIYTVVDGIPVMLEDRGIAASQVAGW
ncbi:MAG: Trm112 family protein [Ectothiorhodospiraceae bacterium]|nr:Trm112 family protein [Chromatiales bacterium]MCP5153479.1 Trm112 family protein [Ectothiorhodospiraceae bacterium]